MSEVMTYIKVCRHRISGCMFLFSHCFHLKCSYFCNVASSKEEEARVKHRETQKGHGFTAFSILQALLEEAVGKQL